MTNNFSLLWQGSEAQTGPCALGLLFLTMAGKRWTRDTAETRTARMYQERKLSSEFSPPSLVAIARSVASITLYRPASHGECSNNEKNLLVSFTSSAIILYTAVLHVAWQTSGGG